MSLPNTRPLRVGSTFKSVKIARVVTGSDQNNLYISFVNKFSILKSTQDDFSQIVFESTLGEFCPINLEQPTYKFSGG